MSAEEQNSSTKITIKQWVDFYSDDLYSWALYKTSDSDTAKDLVQETFIAAFTGFDKFQSRSNPKTWLFSILKNKIIDHYRKSFRQSWVSESKFSTEDSFFENFFSSEGKWPGHWRDKTKPRNDFMAEENSLENEELGNILTECLKKLPSMWFGAINLKYLEECDGKKICQELGISTTNYWQILHRAKLQLRRCLETNWFSE